MDDEILYIYAYSILIAYLFATRTTFFGEKLNDDLALLKNNEKFILLIKLIKRLMLINVINGSSAMILGKNYKIEKLLYGIYPGICFFNHSCLSTVASSLQGVIYHFFVLKKNLFHEIFALKFF